MRGKKGGRGGAHERGKGRGGAQGKGPGRGSDTADEDAPFKRLTAKQKREKLKEQRREHATKQAAESKAMADGTWWSKKGWTAGDRAPESKEQRPPADPVQVLTTAGNDRNRLRTIFAREPDDVVQQRKFASQQCFTRTDTTLRDDLLYYRGVPAMPVRPAWSPAMTKEQVEGNEKAYFVKYVQHLWSQPRAPERLNNFELNIEVWRQLWRTIEMSDILLCLADGRHAGFNFPPALYQYVSCELGKPMVLVLNKVDLIPATALQEWLEYFRRAHPLLRVVVFTSFPHDGSVTADSADPKEKLFVSRKGKTPAGVDTLLQCIKEILREDKHLKERFSGKFAETLTLESRFKDKKAADKDQQDHYDSSTMLTLGLLGHPNAGKSSFLNAITVRKTVSVSKTPGHTKHFQTIILNKQLQLCDCPGLVFPSFDMPRPLQILCGVFPIANVREPYSTVQYLCERIPVETVYRLIPSHLQKETSAVNKSGAGSAQKTSKSAVGGVPVHIDIKSFASEKKTKKKKTDSSDSEDDDSVDDSDSENEEESEEERQEVLGSDSSAGDYLFEYPRHAWSAWEICESYARGRSYHTKKGGLDTYRAANEILRNAHEGRLMWYFLPGKNILDQAKASAASAASASAED